MEEAIDSCLKQTFQNIEIIVINDGSTDPATLSILQKLNKPKTRVIHQKNRGLPAARNAGIREARGKCIVPLDADDTLAPTFIEKTYRIMGQMPQVGFVSTGIRYFGDYRKVRVPPPFNFYRLLFRNFIPVTSLFRKQAWQEAGGYNENMKMGYEDWDFWISLAEKGWLGYRIPDVLFNYRRHGRTMIHRAQRRHHALVSQIRRNHPGLYTAKSLQELRQKWMRT